MRRFRVIKKGIKPLLFKKFSIKIALQIEIIQCNKEINIIVKMIKWKNTDETYSTVLVVIGFRHSNVF